MAHTIIPSVSSFINSIKGVADTPRSRILDKIGQVSFVVQQHTPQPSYIYRKEDDDLFHQSSIIIMGYTHYRKMSWLHCCFGLIYIYYCSDLGHGSRYPCTTAWTTTTHTTAVIHRCHPWRTTPRNPVMRLHDSVPNDDTTATTTTTTTDNNYAIVEPPLAIVVQAEIVPERLDEFLALIEHNAIQSRLEPECLRFDVIQSQDQPNIFFFYEIYANNHSAMDHHKSQAHYQAWADFKANGGTISSTTYKTNGLFLTNH